MTNDETLLLVRFLQNKGMQQNFAWFYNNHRFDKRPLETFLEQTEAEDAILSAFDLAGAPNTIFSPKYWTDLNTKWMKKLKEFRDGGGKLDLSMQTVRCEHCGRQMPRSSFALNTKGQLHKYCRECESGEWDRRRKEEEAAAKEKEKQEKAIKVLEKEIAEKQAKLERLSAAASDTAGTVPAVSSEGEAERITEGLSPSVSPAPKSGTPASDESATKYSPKLGEHDATLHYKPETRKVVFNAVLSAYIYTAGLTKCYLESRRDGRQFLIFNNSEGANVTWLAMKTSRLAQVCSTAHCRQIAEFFHLAIGETYYLHVTKNLSKTQDVINVEIKQVHTREEYAAIAARREEERKAGRPVPGEDVPEYETPVSEDPAGNDAPLIDFSGSDAPKPAPKKPNVVITTGAAKGSDTTVPSKPTASPFGAAIRSTLASGDTSQSLMIPLTGRKTAELLQQLVDRNHLTERDIAKFLYDKGWKLQEPVVVTTHKKFKA